MEDIKLYNAYDTLCNNNRLRSKDIKFLDIKPFEIDEKDRKIMNCILDIDSALLDLRLKYDWFREPIKKYPFLGATPYEYMTKGTVTSLYEVTLYVMAWRCNLLDLTTRSDNV